MYTFSLILKERWFGKDWREVYLVLHEDSTLTWYNERGDSSPEGGIFLKDAPEMIAAGQVRRTRDVLHLTDVSHIISVYCSNS